MPVPKCLMCQCTDDDLYTCSSIDVIAVVNVMDIALMSSNSNGVVL